MASIRSTKLRRAIMEILTSYERPLSVPDLQQLLQEFGMTPHKTSLYRNLEILSSGGEVHEVLLDATGVHYELQRSHHHHTLCRMCDTVTCIANDALEKGMSHLEDAAKKAGFAPAEHHVVLRGLCATCQKA